MGWRRRAPVRAADALLYHKTTARAVYDDARAATRVDERGLLDVLLWNEEGGVTEFALGNVVVEVPAGADGGGAVRSERFSCDGVR